MPDREKVIKGLEICAGNGNCTKCQYGKEKPALSCKKLLSDALELIKSSRLIHIEEMDNMVEVVRCKDCHYGIRNSKEDIFCIKAVYYDKYKRPNWFCADGERRTPDE